MFFCLYDLFAIRFIEKKPYCWSIVSQTIYFYYVNVNIFGCWISVLKVSVVATVKNTLVRLNLTELVYGLFSNEEVDVQIVGWHHT